MSNSIKDALKKLCLKLTGKKSNKESINGVIDDIADNYQEGGGGTSQLYKHQIFWKLNKIEGTASIKTAYLVFQIINSNEQSFTETSLKALLISKYKADEDKPFYLPVNGTYRNSTYGDIYDAEDVLALCCWTGGIFEDEPCIMCARGLGMVGLKLDYYAQALSDFNQSEFYDYVLPIE